jgi:hypothetical protein
LVGWAKSYWELGNLTEWPRCHGGYRVGNGAIRNVGEKGASPVGNGSGGTTVG